MGIIEGVFGFIIGFLVEIVTNYIATYTVGVVGAFICWIIAKILFQKMCYSDLFFKHQALSISAGMFFVIGIGCWVL